MSTELKKMCKSLRLAYVADIYQTIPFENETQYLQDLFNREFQLRDEAKADRLIKKAHFPNKKELESYHWNENIRFPPQIDVKELTALHFIDKHENAILVGAPGTGKSHLAIGLGRKACKKGYEVRFYRVSELVDTLERMWREGKLQQFRNRFKKVDLIVLDEMGYVPFNKEGAELLFQLITDWYEKKSLIITSNLEFSQWNRIFVDARLTAALVDRVIHHAHILSFTGDSYRVTHALSRLL
ncbi:ATP-binding protein [Ureibacillus massiliensis 4400831 = CIP 108448 = CCUG 49529]|uniref:ATP-binding protein n=1 Tax=Ureibacillus massiliensis 4400831 = CIP 108448 = CCUG 49529 TaxID=1211035 RepID=A0A0A3J1I6_9BACL|nr:IS21-like element helper ATPase IstB [Ureibacillus massiliensis]KGR89058.1 ATP-binding protein [Ureibacillus massiliensis 4400831 = CIP 108448 = CCUG 49529]